MVGRRFIAGTTNTKREISNRIRDRQVAYWTLMQSALKFHLRGTAQGPDPPHFGVLGQGFIPDPLRALCGAAKGLYPRPAPSPPAQTNPKRSSDQARDEVALKPLPNADIGTVDWKTGFGALRDGRSGLHP